MRADNNHSNPVNLQNLHPDKIKKQKLILTEDIWKRGILVLKSGKPLTEKIIEKLLNFGIYEVNVYVSKDDYIEEENKALEQLKRNFIQEQNILIIDKNFNDIGYLARSLKGISFNEKNMYIASNIKAIYKYLQAKTPNYLFINYYTDVLSHIRELKNNYYLDKTHIFLTLSLDESKINIKELESKISLFKTRLILKPLTVNQLKNILDEFISRDFQELLNPERNDQELSEIKIFGSQI